MRKQKLNPVVWSRGVVVCYSWRDLTLTRVENKYQHGWRLCHSGSYKRLKTGEESILFGTLAMAKEHLLENYNMEIRL